MRISINWINELINIQDIQLDNLIEKMTLGGFEVEDVIELTPFKKTTTVLDISATANRADSLSVYGLGKEMGSLLNKPIQKSTYHREINQQKEVLENILIKNASEENINLSIFLGLTVKHLTNVCSPKWLQEKLISADIIPVNNLLDYKNYILLETGYPFEFYDLSKIKQTIKRDKFKLAIKTTEQNETIKINNNDCLINNKILTLNANNQILGVSGVIPTDEYQYLESSSELLIEASIFNSKKIRQTSRALGIRTERSARYEKELMVSDFSEALLRLLLLLKINNPNVEFAYYTIYNKKTIIPAPIVLDYKNINKILGPIINQESDMGNELESYLTFKQISNYLDRLNFKYSYNNESQTWVVSILTSRINDISREIDLIEEIGRLHGFNNFKTCLPQVVEIGKEDLTYKLKKQLTLCFLNEGFTELIQYSLTNQNLPNTISIVNPLFSECSQLRQSLLPGLVKTVNFNLKNTNLSLNGFEYGHIFKTDKLSKYKEIEYIAGVLGSQTNISHWSTNHKSISNLDWFIAKGKLETIFHKLNLQVKWELENIKLYDQILHPYRTAKLTLDNGSELGVFGQIHPLLANKLNISDNIYLFELNFEIIKNKIKFTKLCLYNDYSTYPKITKDLSFLIDKSISFNKIKSVIQDSGSQFLSCIDLLDVYQTNEGQQNIQSLCVQLTFHAPNKTLVNTEIEYVMKNIQDNLIKNFNITLRI